MKTKTLIPFFLLSFGISWGIVGILVLFPTWVENVFGPLSVTNPLFMLAVYAPAIAAFTLITRTAGISGLKRFLSRLLLWRVSYWWYIFILLGIPVLFYAGTLVKGNFLADPFPFTSITSLLAALGMMLIIGPVEEFGWRGLALPLLQRRFTPLYASIILGVIWGVWHLPAFFLSGTPQSTWSFAPFFIAAIALSIIITPMFNASKGSILLPVLYHFQLNNPVLPDAQPYDTYFFAFAAILVVIFFWKTLTTRDKAVTTVIPISLHNSDEKI